MDIAPTSNEQKHNFKADEDYRPNGKRSLVRPNKRCNTTLTNLWAQYLSDEEEEEEEEEEC